MSSVCGIVVVIYSICSENIWDATAKKNNFMLTQESCSVNKVNINRWTIRDLYYFMIEILKSTGHVFFCGEEDKSLIYVLSHSIELYKGTLHLDRSIKVRSQCYQSRWWEEGKSSQQAMLPQPNGSCSAAESKREGGVETEGQRASEWDRESKMLLLLYGFDWLCIFFLSYS